MPTKETLTRDRLAVLAAAVDGMDADRIELGQVDLIAENLQDFFKDIASDGPFLVIGPAEQTGIEYEPHKADFDILCELYFGFPNDASYDFKAIEEIVFPLRDAFVKVSNYTGQSISAPVSWSTSKPEVLRKHKPCVGRYEIKLTFRRALNT